MEYRGIAASPGIAMGPPFCFRQLRFHVEKESAQSAPENVGRWESARRDAVEELRKLVVQVDDDQRMIFEAHIDIARDCEIDEMVRKQILEEGTSAEWAVQKAFGVFRDMLAEIEDPIFAERAADLDDVQRRILRFLGGAQQMRLDALPYPVVLVADDLLPSDTAMLDRKNVLGIVTQTGGMTSHSAILARSFGIPAVLGVPNAIAALENAAQIILDGTRGIVISGPSQDLLEQYRQAQCQAEAHAAAAKRYLRKPAALKDGRPMQVGLNIGGADYPKDCGQYDFVGLFRTEFLYMNSDHLPTEEEQFAAYRQVLQCAGDRTVTLRTLDIGGDKTLPYLKLPEEMNPFLGKRALRLCLEQEDLFQTQLCAALRASAYGNLRLMFPMVGSLEDIDRAKECVRRAMRTLERRGKACNGNIPLGIMIEIPAIAELAGQAAQEVDFASIGTNDLCQYLYAADRLNPDCTEYYQCFGPAFLRVLERIIQVFRAAGKEICVCGELAGDTRATALLAAMGLEKYSVNASQLPALKQEMASFTMDEAKELKQKVWKARTQAEILAQIEAFQDNHKEGVQEK